MEERNGDAHDEAEHAADEEEEGGGEGEEVVEDEGAPAEEDEEEDQAVEETDEVTDDTVNAARPESTSPPSIPGMLCLLCPLSSHHSHHSRNAPFFLLLSISAVCPSFPLCHFSSSHRHLCTHFVESRVSSVSTLKLPPSVMCSVPGCSTFFTLSLVPCLSFHGASCFQVFCLLTHSPRVSRHPCSL